MTTESCGTCKFFKRHISQITEGFCKRMPPVVIIAPIGKPPQPRPVSASPNMAQDDWCGEYKMKVTLQ